MDALARQLPRFILAAFAAVLLLLSACGGEDGPPTGGVEKPVTFVFAIDPDEAGSQSFIASTDDPAVIALARAQLLLPASQRMLHINGPILPAQPPQNGDWHWRFADNQWNLVQASVEVCDGTPRLVEDNLDYWLKLGRFCPWGAYVAMETDVPVASGIIVKFTGSADGAQLQQLFAMVEAAAAARGTPLTYRLAGASGTHVWDFDGLMPASEASRVAQAITAAVAGVEYAEPNLLMQTH